MAKSRIVSSRGILGGKPRIAGTRIGADFVLELMASGMSAKEIVKEYPNLSDVDIQAVLRYAKSAVSKEEVMILPSLRSKLIPAIAG